MCSSHILSISPERTIWFFTICFRGRSLHWNESVRLQKVVKELNQSCWKFSICSKRILYPKALFQPDKFISLSLSSYKRLNFFLVFDSAKNTREWNRIKTEYKSTLTFIIVKGTVGNKPLNVFYCLFFVLFLSRAIHEECVLFVSK